MPRTAQESARARAQLEALAKHYRAIGPAAILAALLCAPKARKKHALPQQKAA